jgi:hypothetical protein
MRGVAKHSVDLGKISPSQEEPSGAPSNPAGTEPMDEDPSNEAIILSLLEGYGADEAEAMDIETPPPPCGGFAKQVPLLDGSRGATLGSDQGDAHHQEGQIIHRY